MLSLSPATLEHFRHRGHPPGSPELPWFRIGRNCFYDVDAIEEFISKCQARAQAERNGE
jgi:hypothetical protein